MFLALCEGSPQTDSVTRDEILRPEQHSKNRKVI